MRGARTDSLCWKLAVALPMRDGGRVGARCCDGDTHDEDGGLFSPYLVSASVVAVGRGGTRNVGGMSGTTNELGARCSNSRRLEEARRMSHLTLPPSLPEELSGADSSGSCCQNQRLFPETGSEHSFVLRLNLGNGSPRAVPHPWL